jgi:RecA/RadA recombinase
MSKELMSSGSTLIDLVLGGGLEPGSILNLIAESGTGKSFIAAEIIANSYSIYKDRLKWRYLDVEAGFKFDTKELYGIDIIDNTKPTPNTVEDMAADLAIELDNLKDDQFLIYIIDSYDALSSKAEQERDKKRTAAYKKDKDFDEGTYALNKAKFGSEFFRLRSQEIENKNCLLVIISQTRANVNGGLFGPKTTRSGGKALDFYASSILTIRRTDKLEKTIKGITREYGYNLRVKAKKSRNKNPYRECDCTILYSYGLDDITSNIDFLYGFRTDGGKSKAQKSSKVPKKDWIEEEGEWNKIDFINWIEDNQMEEEVKRRVKEKWDYIDNAIIPERKSRFSKKDD